MHKIKIRVYQNGRTEFAEFMIPQLVTRTGDENQFRYASDCAERILEGIKWARPEARCRIEAIELQP